MQKALARYGVQGGRIAVAKDGHLLFARGYGFADAEAQTPVQPRFSIRWGSIAKDPNPAAVRSAPGGAGSLISTHGMEYLSQYSQYNGKWGDRPSLPSITVRQLTASQGGGDRARAYDR